MPRSWIVAVVGTVTLCAAAQRAAAQDPYVRIREPAEMGAGKPYPATPGQSVLISGVAWHPSGVKQILVNGGIAMLVPEAPLMDFEFRLVPDTNTRAVVVRVVSNSGEAFQATFSLALATPPPAARPAAPATTTAPAAAAAKPPAPVATRSPAPTTAPATAPGAAPAAAPTTSTAVVSGPWDGFQRRSVFYVAGTALGIVLATRESATSSQVTGGALMAGASLAIGIVDFALTSREANAASASPGSGGRGPMDLAVAPGVRHSVVMQLRWWY